MSIFMLLLCTAVFATAQTDVVSTSAVTVDPFMATSEASVSVDAAIDEIKIDSADVEASLDDGSRIHTLSYGQGYLVADSGEITLTNGFWNVVSNYETTKGRGQLRVGPVTFQMKATASSETKKSFDLYHGNTMVGTAVFTRTKSDRMNAIWEVSVDIETEERSASATGMFATLTKTVTPSADKPNKETRETRVTEKVASNMATEEAKEARDAARRWWQFWKPRVEARAEANSEVEVSSAES